MPAERERRLRESLVGGCGVHFFVRITYDHQLVPVHADVPAGAVCNQIIEAHQRVANTVNVDVRGTMETGVAVLEFVVGCDTFILVDAIQINWAAFGHIQEITPEQLKFLAACPPHFLGVAGTLLMGRKLGLAVPTPLQNLRYRGGRCVYSWH